MSDPVPSYTVDTPEYTIHCSNVTVKKKKPSYLSIPDILLITLGSSAVFFLGMFYSAPKFFQIRDNLGATGEVDVMKISTYTAFFAFVVLFALSIVKLILVYSY